MSNLTPSYQVGYRGLGMIGTSAADAIIMLCTGGSVSVSQDPIMSGGVWGAGEKNISPVAYAWNYLTMDCSMNVEMATAENYWKQFHSGTYFVLLPEGTGGFTGGGYRTTTSVEASEGSALTGTVSFKDTGGSISGGKSWDEVNGDATHRDYGYGNKPTQLAGSTLVPYWRTGAYTNCENPSSITPTDEGDASIGGLISWNVSRNRDVQFLKCCSMNASSPLDADYVVFGEITGDCSMTWFGLSGLEGKYFHDQYKNLTFILNMGGELPGYSTTPGKAKMYEKQLAWVQVPIAIRNSGSTSMTTGANYITSEFSYTAIGDTTKCGVTFGPDEDDSNP